MMKGGLSHLLEKPSPSVDANSWESQRLIWTRDVTRMMALVIAVAAAVILGGTLAGMFEFSSTLPIYVLLLVTLPTYLLARQGRFSWVRVFPALFCFLLGAYSSYDVGFRTIMVLFYAMAVLLAGMLAGNRWGFIMLFASILAYTGLGVWREHFSPDELSSIITFVFGLVGIALLQWYTQLRLRQLLASLVSGNRSLQAEIDRRRAAEQTQHEQEGQLRRLAENTTDLVTEIDAQGQMRYVSPSYLSGLGYDPQSLIGTNGFDLVHPDDRPSAYSVAQRAAARRQPDRVQLRVQHADGHYLYMEVSGRPLFTDQDELVGYVLSSRDIDQQKRAEFVVQESEQKFRSIIEALPLGIHMYDLLPGGDLVFSGYNPAANVILGMDHAMLIGQTIEMAFPALVGTEIPDCYREVAREGGIWQKEQVDYSRIPIDGAFEVHAFQVSAGKLVVMFADITERIRAAEALRTSEEKFSTAFVTSPDSVNINRLSDGLYLEINQGFTTLTGYTQADVAGKSSLDLNIWNDPADRARLVKGLVEHGMVDNLEAQFRRQNGEVGTGLMSARMIEIQGEKCILSITRDITARIQAETQLREAHRKLEEAYEATLEGWARALELREHETAFHSRRVVEYTLQIASALGMDGEQLVHIRRGALLHDIGKMGVPDNILLKPGRLTDDEWVTMRQHTEFAKTLISKIAYLHESIAIPYSHHEKWDGSGYPQRLKGEEIPLGARIFAVVDVYDALTHDRPYRPAWSRAEARRYLVEQRGTHFDPAIVDIFLGMI